MKDFHQAYPDETGGSVETPIRLEGTVRVVPFPIPFCYCVFSVCLRLLALIHLHIWIPSIITSSSTTAQLWSSFTARTSFSQCGSCSRPCLSFWPFKFNTLILHLPLLWFSSLVHPSWLRQLSFCSRLRSLSTLGTSHSTTLLKSWIQVTISRLFCKLLIGLIIVLHSWVNIKNLY